MASSSSTSSCSCLVLRSISGSQCTVRSPPAITFQTILDAAVDTLHFRADTVKIFYDDGIKKVAELAAGASTGPLPFEIERLRKGGGSGRYTPDTMMMQSSPIVTSSNNGGCIDVVTVFGVPQGVGRKGGALYQKMRCEQQAAAENRQKKLQQQQHLEQDHHQQQQQQQAGGRTPVPGSYLASYPGPLPYPHCPDGLEELSAIAASAGPLAATPDFYFSHEFYEHPTTQFIISDVNGNLSRLRAVMEQISAACPTLYRWVERYQALFLRYLNRQMPSATQSSMQMLVQKISSTLQMGQRHFTLEVNDVQNGLVGQLVVEVDPDTAAYMGDGDHSDHEEDDNDDNMWDDTFSGSISADDEEQYADMNLALEEEHLDYMYDESEPSSGRSPRSSVETIDDDNEGDDGEPEGALPGADAEAVRCLGNDVHPNPPPPPHEPVVAYGGGGSSSRRPFAPLEVTRAYRPPQPLQPPPAPEEEEEDHDGEVRMPRIPKQRQHRAQSLVCRARRESLSRLAMASPDSAPLLPAAAISDPLYAHLEAELSVLDEKIQHWRTHADPHDLDTIHCNLQTHSAAFLKEMGENLAAVCNEQNFMWLTQTANAFFSKAEEFYLHVMERGVRPSVFGNTTLAAYACRAALGRLLVVAADRAVKRSASIAGLGKRRKSRGSGGGLRVGALRNLPAEHSPLMAPCARWVHENGPARLLDELMALAAAQRTAVLWYTSHYVLHPPRLGRRLETAAYVINGEGVSPVRLAKKVPPTAPPGSAASASGGAGSDEDVVMRCLLRLREAGKKVTDAQREEWLQLMSEGYEELVKPLEAFLPSAHTVPALYVVDTRHCSALCSAAASAEAPALGMGRWFGAYMDDRRVHCMDKWGITVSEAPWRLILAEEANTCQPAPGDALLVVLSNTDAPQRSTWAVALRQEQREQAKLVHHSLEAKSLKQRHAVILHETTNGLNDTALSTSLSLSQPLSPCNFSGTALTPLILGDLHVLDVCHASTGLGNSAALVTHRATLFRNISLSGNDTDSFFKSLYLRLRMQPALPLASAFRQAIMLEAHERYAPWLLCEYTLMDYGGALDFIAAPLSKPGSPLAQSLIKANHVNNNNISNTGSVVGAGGGGGRTEQRWRHYAEANAVDDLFEMMLGRLQETRPSDDVAVLDDLVHYVEATRELMGQRVQERRRLYENASSDAQVSSTSGELPTVTAAVQPAPPQGGGGPTAVMTHTQQDADATATALRPRPTPPVVKRKPDAHNSSSNPQFRKH